MDIAIDVDGVLAEQVIPVLNLIEEKYGVTMQKSDIKSWDEPIPNTNSNIKIEIEESHENDQYVLSMPVIDGARSVVNELKREGHEIYIVTSRVSQSNYATERWLNKNNIKYNKFYNTNGIKKSLIKTDLLIDDYPGNISDFVSRRRYAILFLQPWNNGHRCLESDRVFSAHEWTQIPTIINNLT